MIFLLYLTFIYRKENIKEGKNQKNQKLSLQRAKFNKNDEFKKDKYIKVEYYSTFNKSE